MGKPGTHIVLAFIGVFCTYTTAAQTSELSTDKLETEKIAERGTFQIVTTHIRCRVHLDEARLIEFEKLREQSDTLKLEVNECAYALIFPKDIIKDPSFVQPINAVIIREQRE